MAGTGGVGRQRHRHDRIVAVAGHRPATAQARIRVSQIGGPATDQSNAAFTIAAAALAVTAPNTNVNWGIGSSRQIRWSHNLGTLPR